MELPENLAVLIRSRCRFLPDDAPLNPDAPLSTLGVDSLEIVDLIIEIEDSFGMEIPQELLTPEVFKCARTIWQAVDQVLAEQGDRLPIDS